MSNIDHGCSGGAGKAQRGGSVKSSLAAVASATKKPAIKQAFECLEL